MANEFLRRILRDRESLRDYRAGRMPDLDAVRRRVFVAERQSQTRWPDHVHKNLRQFRQGEPQTLCALLLRMFRSYQETFLLYRGDRLHLTLDRFGAWQEEISNLSPLCFVAFAIQKKVPPPDSSDLGALADYAERCLSPFRHSLLLTPICPEIEDLVAAEGLYETHLHLNGSTEVDKIWQEALRRPRRFIAELSQPLRRKDNPRIERDMLSDLYEQVEPGLKPEEIARRLHLARRLRIALCERLFGRYGISLPASIADITGTDDPLPFEDRVEHGAHPLRAILPMKNAGVLEYELLLMALILHRMERNGDEWLAGALHCYLLILNATLAPLAVQQTEQKGFDQFQKLTFTGVRSLSEKTFRDRFHQICNGHNAELALIEGRLAPADSREGLKKQLRTILSGFGAYQADIAKARGMAGMPVTRVTLTEECPEVLNWASRPDLRLIAHFIKKDELNDPRRAGGTCRFSTLRADIARRWRVLRHVRNQHALARHFVTGLDAAANELHTPPEVFAPLFRAGRRSGMIHFTFHAGEDFTHLIGGIRAVYEAMEFLELRDGNRIGHATAIGIDAKLWLDRAPPKLVLPRGELLDNLVFLRQMLLGDPALADVLPHLDERIHRLARHIYSRSVDPQLLWSAWRMRHLDARFLHLARESVCPQVVEDDVEEWKLLHKAYKEDPQALALLEEYHRPEVIKLTLELEEWDNIAVKAPVLTALQRAVLKEVVRRRVVLETLPTSNVRISYYEGHHEHHVFRWLDRASTEPKPIVTIGSDDPGIFACNLKGEYVHLLQAARRRDMDDRDAAEMLRELNRNGRLYSFR